MLLLRVLKTDHIIVKKKKKVVDNVTAAHAYSKQCVIGVVATAVIFIDFVHAVNRSLPFLECLLFTWSIHTATQKEKKKSQTR